MSPRQPTRVISGKASEAARARRTVKNRRLQSLAKRTTILSNLESGLPDDALKSRAAQCQWCGSTDAVCRQERWASITKSSVSAFSPRLLLACSVRPSSAAARLPAFRPSP